MLQSFQVKNFKSFIEARLDFRPVTVLIGANASGKTNLLEALQLFSWMADGRQLSQVLSAVRDEDLSLRGTLPELTWEGSEIEFGCEVGVPDSEGNLRLELKLALDFPLGPRVVSEVLRASGSKIPLYDAEFTGSAHGLDIRYDNFARGGKKPKISASALQPAFTQLMTPARFAAKHGHSQRRIPRACTVLSKALRSILVLDPAARRMRKYSHKLDRDLRSDGANISAVMAHLCATGRRENILEFVRALPEQNIVGVGFIETPREEVMLKLRETFGGTKHWREAAVLSDGTLRALAIAAALLSVAEGSTVVIEEVDNGIHAARVGRILTQMRKVAQERDLRVLVTTHNPAMLDALPDEELPHVIACYRDPTRGDSRLVALGEIERFPEIVARGSLGHVVTHGVLDKFIKQTPGAKQAANKRWLAALRSASK